VYGMEEVSRAQRRGDADGRRCVGTGRGAPVAGPNVKPLRRRPAKKFSEALPRKAFQSSAVQGPLHVCHHPHTTRLNRRHAHRAQLSSLLGCLRRRRRTPPCVSARIPLSTALPSALPTALPSALPTALPTGGAGAGDGGRVEEALSAPESPAFPSIPLHLVLRCVWGSPSIRC